MPWRTVQHGQVAYIESVNSGDLRQQRQYSRHTEELHSKQNEVWQLDVRAEQGRQTMYDNGCVCLPKLPLEVLQLGLIHLKDQIVSERVIGWLFRRPPVRQRISALCRSLSS
jgi:hypothetical protein